MRITVCIQGEQWGWDNWAARVQRCNRLTKSVSDPTRKMAPSDMTVFMVKIRMRGVLSAMLSRSRVIGSGSVSVRGEGVANTGGCG